jgi:ATP-dependent helicase/nuclease subunit A
MAKVVWTKHQEKAIELKGGGIALSAAAGSGKTAVLVERVIQLLLDEKDPCHPSELLVVTFTNAAAGEMRQKIKREINSRIALNPFDVRLTKLKIGIESADICTMDSFCIKLLRENFHKTDISPDFRPLDGSEETALRKETLESVIEELYMERGEAFRRMADVVTESRSDAALGEFIETLYNQAMVYPFPFKWLDSVAESYENSNESIWHDIIRGKIKEVANYCISLVNDALTLSYRDEVLAARYPDVLERELSNYKRIADLAEGGDWDELMNSLKGISFDSLPTIRNMGDNIYKLSAQAKRNKAKGTIMDCKEKYAVATSDEHKEDLTYLLPVIRELVNAAMVFSDRLFDRMKAKNAYSFSVLNQLALRLLIKEDENGDLYKTELAQELSDNYKHVLIDEYQDTNELQNTIFRTLSSEGEKLFVVGDVKQSIYRFRLAMPEIFLSLLESSADADERKFPARLFLDRNFRSRKDIISAVNFLFSCLMSKETGDVEYTEGHEMIAGAEYEDEEKRLNPAVSLHILEHDKQNSELKKLEAEAKYIASFIKRTIQSGVTVGQKEKKHPVRASDFCILIRNANAVAYMYRDALIKEGIDAYAEEKNGFFGATEIAVMLSFLRTIDNPSRDVDLLALMFSPIYGFTPDEIAELRMLDKNASLYSCLSQYVLSGNEKAKTLMEDIRLFRNLSGIMPTAKFIRSIYEKTGYMSIVGAMSRSEKRKANLSLLCEYAEEYEKNKGTGLSGFIRKMDILQRMDGDLPSASGVSEGADVVRIMTVHKSKGLEFPYVIIANCAGIMYDNQRRYTVTPETGLGVKIRNAEKLNIYSTVPSVATGILARKNEAAEYLRLLYVAMTRAREALIMVSSFESTEKKVQSAVTALPTEGNISSYAVSSAQSFADWLLLGFLRHPDAAKLRNMCAAGELIETQPADFSLDVVLNAEDDISQDEPAAEFKADRRLLREIEKRVAYEYPYSALAAVPAKMSASELFAVRFNSEFFALSKPAFACDGEMTASEKGSANHKFLQLCDLGAASKDIDAELNRLLSTGKMTEQEINAVSKEAAEGFFNSDTARRILEADRVLREQNFTIQIPAAEIFRELKNGTAADEKILIQGRVDLVYVKGDRAVVVDYKTDRVTSEKTLVSRYEGQLTVYLRAVSEILRMPRENVSAELYSLHLNKSIPVEYKNLI